MAGSVATVASLEGQAWAKAPDGKLRELKVGDTVTAEEVVITAPGAHVDLDFGDGHPVSIAGGQEVTMNRDLWHDLASDNKEAAVQDASVQEALTVLNNGGDLTENLEETAAGLTGGGGNEGHSFVELARVIEATDPNAFNFGVANPASATAPEITSVGATNHAPLVADQSFGGNEDSVIAGQVIASDIEGDTLTFSLVGQPGNGTLLLNANTGDFTYIPNTNYNGPDSFIVRVTDASGNTTDTTVSLSVAAVNDAPVTANQNLTTAEDTPVAGRITASDAEGDSLSYSLTTAAAHGSVTLDAATGAFVYTPGLNFNGSDRFVVTVTDGNGGVTTSVINLGVTPVNDAPVSANQTLNVAEDTPIAGTVAATDVDGNSLSYSVASPVAHGTLSLNAATGSFVYTPASGYTGSDSFTVTVSDGQGGITQSVVSLGITPAGVNTVPNAVDDLAVTNAGTPVTIAVLANDSDANGDDLEVTGVTQGTNGSVVLDGSGNAVYTPNPGFVGNDSFTYTLSDGNGGFDTATVSVSVNAIPPVNVVPVAGDDTVTVAVNTPAILAVRANDADADGDSLLVTSVTQGAHGTVTIDAASGNPIYTPGAGYVGSDSFSYTVSDGKGGTDTATVNITVAAAVPVNQSPTAAGDALVTNEDTPLVISPASLLGNDVDPDGDALTITGVQNVTGGTLAQVGGNYVFTPAANYNGPASFTYSVSDGKGGSSTATVNITVAAVDDASVLAPDSQVIAEDSVATGNLLTNDADIDSVLQIASFSVGGNSYSAGDTAVLASGTLVVSADGSYSFTPAANFSGPVPSVDYTTTSGASSTLSLTVTPVNDSPLAAADSLSTNEDTPLVISPANLLVNDTDVDGDALSITGVQDAVNGTVSLVGGNILFTPNPGYNGPASFTYSLTDGQGGTATGTVSIAVVSVNDAPETNPATAVGSEDTAVLVTLTGSDTDGSVVGYSINSLPANGTLYSDASLTQIITAGDLVTGPVYFKPAANWNGSTSFDYSAVDDQGLGDPTPVTAIITVNPVADGASLGSGAGSVKEDTPGQTTTGGTISISDPDAGETGFVAQNNVAGTYGSFSLDAAGNWTYSLDNSNPLVQALHEGETATDSFLVTSIDGTTTSVDVLVTGTLDSTILSLSATGSVAEGGNITYVASLTEAAHNPVTVTLGNGAVIAIAAGASQGSVTVAAPADDAHLDASSLSTTITTAIGGGFENLVLNTAPAVTSVTDTLDTTNLSLSATGSVAEGGSITYTATLTNAADGPVTVTLSNGAIITIANGATAGSVAVPLPADDVYLNAGTVSATIATASGGNFEDLVVSQVPAVTAVADTVDTTTLSLVGSLSVAENDTASYTLSLNHPADTDLTVNLVYSGTAVNGTDIIGTLSVVIAAGTSAANFDISAVMDGLVEGTESFTIAIDSVSGGNFENLLINPTANAVTTNVLDLDTATVSLAATANLTEAGGAVVYTATITEAPVSDLGVILSNGQTITILAGQLTGSLSVVVPASDDVYTDPSSVSATITGITGGGINVAVDPAAAVTLINDTIDDTGLSLSAAASLVEGGNITYTATLTHAAQGAVTVNLSNGSVITIADGATSGSVTLAVPGDDVYQDAGLISAKITSTSGGNFENLIVDSSPAVTSITDSLDATGLSLSATGSVAEGGSIIYTATLTNPAQGPVTVNLANGSVITIADGATSGFVSVPAHGDTVFLDAGNVSNSISFANGGNFESLVVDSTPVVTSVTDTPNTTLVSLSGASAISEGDSGSYTLTLSHAAQTAVTVTLNYSGTAVDGTDFTGVIQVIIPANASAASFNVAALDDLLVEDVESFTVTITGATGGNFENLSIDSSANSVTTGVIDTDTANVSLSATPNLTEAGGSVVYTATLTEASSTATTVTLSNGQSINIAAGQLTGSVSVAVPAGDDVYVDPTTISANITGVSGNTGIVVDATPAVTAIADTVDTTTVSLGAASTVAEGGSILYTATLTSPAQGAVTVNLSNGSAITIADGATNGTVSVPVHSDTVYVDAGSVSVHIVSASGGNFEDLAVDSSPVITNVTDTADTTSLSLAATNSVAEGGNIVYTATLTNAAQGPVTVNLSNGSVITIANGLTTGTVSVPVHSDSVYLDAASVSTSITSVTGGNFENLTFNPNPAITSVTDTLDVTTLSLTGASSLTEGGAPGVYTLSLTNQAQTAVTVTLNYSGTAANGSDFSGTTTIIIPANSSSTSFNIAALDDVEVEGTESFTLSIGSVSGGNFESLVVSGSANSVTTSIVDTDTTTVSLSATPSLTEAGGTAVYTATLSQTSSTATTVSLSNGQNITIAAGQLSGSVSSVVPASDDVYADPASISTNITGLVSGNPGILIDATPAVTAITDTIDTTTVSLGASASVAEGGSILYTATLTSPAQGAVTVNLSNGSAITIADGATTGTVSVPVHSDTVYLDAGSVSTSITSASGGNFENLTFNSTPAVTTVTDTINTTTASLSATNSVAEGGAIVYTATLTNAAQGPVTVNLSNGSTITIASGATTGTVSVPVHGDTVYLDAGSVSTTITGATGGNFENLTFSSAPAVTNVTDSLDVTTLSLTGANSITEGGAAGVYTLSLTNPAQTAVTVTLNYSGTAANGTDFSGTTTVGIPANSSSANFSISALDDVLVEGAESFTVSIAGATGGNFESLVVSSSANSVTTGIVDTDTASVSLSATPSITESGGTVVYTATLGEASSSATTVSLSNGQSITIAAGQLTGTVSVVVPASDDVYVDPTSVSASITGVSGNPGITINSTPATTNVTDTIDTTTVSLSASGSVAEGGNIVYTATLTNPAQGAVSVNLSNGSVITIANGATSGTVSVPVHSDTVYVDAGSVSTAITSASGGNFENLSVNSTPVVTTVTDTVNITNLSLSATNSVAEGGNIVYTATLTNPAQGAVTVNLSNGSVITIANGATTGTVSVPVHGDTVYVDAGSVSTTITSASGGNFENLAVSSTPAVTTVTDTVNTTTVSLSATSSVAEGGSIVYTATLTNAAQGAVTVNLSNGSAITIANGSTTGTISVPVHSDTVYLDAGSVSTTITTASGGNFESLAVNPTAAVTSVTDTVNVTTLSLTGASSITEGGAAGSYTLSLTSPAQTAVTVTLNYTGTAINGTDFSGTTTVTIPANSSSANFSIAALDDVLVEGAESFSVGIAGATGGNFESLVISSSANSVTTSIVDTDTASVSLSATPSLTEAGGTVVYTATLSEASSTATTVGLSNGQTITIAAGQLTGTVSLVVPASDDVYLDPSSVSASITGVVSGNPGITANATPAVTAITDTIDTTTVSLNATGSVAEGGNIVYTATLTNPAQGAVTVNLSNGSVITIANGATAGTVSVPVHSDTVYLDAGSVSTTITSASGGNFENLSVNSSPAVTTVTDTINTTTVSLSASSSVAEGGNIVYTATLTNAAQAPVTVNLSNGSTITIANGATTGTVSVPVHSDTVYLDAGSVSTAIISAAGGNFENLAVNSTAVVTSVTDTINVTTLSLTGASSITEGGAAGSYTLSLTSPAQTAVTVTLNYTGTAVNGVDFSGTTTVTIPANSSSANFTIAALDDVLVEGAESFTLSIAGATGGNFESLAISGSSGSVTTNIVDTDTATVSLSATPSLTEAGGTAVYTATLSQASSTTTTVSLSNGQSISIAAGQLTGSVSVAVPASDDVYVDPTSISASITGVTGNPGIAINSTPAVTSITDTIDTTTVSLSATGSVAEGGNIVYTATLTNAAHAPVTVNLSNGSVITIANGATTGTVSIPVHSDTIYLDAGSVSTTITSAASGNFENLAVSPTAAVTTVTDTINTTTVSLSATNSVAEGGNIVYTATLTNPAQGAVTVNLSNGSAITIANGATTGTVSVPVHSDTVYVDAGSVSTTITSATGGNFESLAVSPTAAVTTVTDTINTTTVSLSATNTVAEGGNIVYTATLTNPAHGAVTVNLSNGSVITIANGANTGTVSVPVHSDTVYLDAGSVSTTITSATGGNFESLAVSSTAAVTTVTDTVSVTTLSLTGATSIAESSAGTYTLTLSNPAQTSVTVNLNYSGTAANGTDYTGVSSVTIPAGSSSATFSIQTLTDSLTEGNESFTVSVGTVSGGNFESLVVNGSANSVTTTIVDNRAPDAIDDSASGSSSNQGIVSEYFGYREGTDGANLTSLSQIFAFINGRTADATFTAKTFDYGAGNTFGNNLGAGTNLQTFLGSDAASLSTDPVDTSDAIIHMRGFVQLSAGTYNFRVFGDDGYQVKVDGVVVAESNKNQSPTTTVHAQFTVSGNGLHNIEVVYWDQGGQATFKLELSNDSGTTYNLLSSYPTYKSAGFAVVEDTPTSFTKASLLANDTDPDNDSLSIVSVQGATHGTVSMLGSNVVFTPDANYNGPASFTYTVSDGRGGFDTATVNLSVTPVNDAPVTLDDASRTNTNTALVLTAATLMTNDSDVDADTLTLTSVQGAVNGTVSLSGTNVTFTPTTNFEGAASFTYTIKDLEGASSTATVNVSVGTAQAPSVAVEKVITVIEHGGVATSISLPIITALVDTDGSESLSVKLTGVPTGATLNHGTYDSATSTWNLVASDLSDLSLNLPANYSTGTGYTTLTAQVISTETYGGYTASTSSSFKLFGASTTADLTSTNSGSVTGTSANEYINGGSGDNTLNGGDGNDVIFGLAGNDSLSGGNGQDIIYGGLGNDTINGGNGVDRIYGGAGNDSLTGGSDGSVDVFAWSLGDQGTAGAPAVDTITDFGTAAPGNTPSTGGDILDLRDLLSGDVVGGANGAGNLTDYLHFEISGGNTIVHVSHTGGFNADSHTVGASYTTGAETQQIVLTGVNLSTLYSSTTSDATIITNLLNNNKLITD